MQKNNAALELRKSIQLIENEQIVKGQELKEQFVLTLESMPLNLIETVIKDITSPSNSRDSILATVAGMASGYISKKIVVGTSDSIGRKFMGKILQIGVANVVANHSEDIKMLGQFILQRVFRRKG